MNSTAVICADCGAGNPDINAYCGECGKRIVRRGDGVTLHPGFKGPRRLLIASGVVFAVSAAIAAVDFLLIQALNPGLDVGGPIINVLLDAANVTSVRAPGSPSDGVSFLIVGAFLLASLTAIASAVSGAAGGIWLLARWRDSEGPARVGTAVAETGRKGLEDAHRLGTKGLEKARPRLTETAERSRAAAKQARDSAAERYEDAKPVVRRVAREGRATFSEEVAPRVSTGIRKGIALSREWIESRRDKVAMDRADLPEGEVGDDAASADVAGRIRTVEAFRDALRSGAGVLITDTATGVTFHPDPASCSHVREEFFRQKVVENGERNGSYFAVASFADAKKRWPDVRSCGLE